MAHQARAIDGARQAYREGSRSILIVAPTGAGKTRIGVEIARGAQLRRGARVLWLAHRHELLDQARAQLDAAGATGMLVESVQSLAVMATPPEVELVVFDEAAHYAADEWGAVARHYADRIRIGLTAVPCRHDGRGLEEIFDTMVVAASVRELTDLGVLVPCDVIGPGGKRDALAADPVTAYRDLAENRRAVVFCASVAHAKHVAEQFCEIGIRAECVDGKLPTGRRDAVLHSFRMGAIRVLTNVQILTEGWDCPEAEVCILALAASHVGSYLQRIGRVLRRAPGKRRALVIDLKGSAWQHGLPDDDRVYSLTGKPISDVEGLVKLTSCRVCGAIFRWVPACPRCGARPPALVDPKIKREALRKIADVESQDKRQSFYAAKVAEGRAKGYKPMWAVMQFKVRYGYFPSWRAAEVSS